LSPISFEQDGLVEALNGLAEQTRTVAGVECVFECEPEIQIDDAQMATHVFRICQEAVNNALKHSGSSRIGISLRTNAERLELRVSDDGNGFSTRTQSENGLGLRAMKYRADLIGGRLEIDAAPGKGAQVMCTIYKPG
jgi:signal transduction histidine kinase